MYPQMPEWGEMLSAIRSEALVIVDLETSSLSPFTGRIAGAGVRVGGKSYYVPARHEGLISTNVSDEGWKEFCESLQGVSIVNHNVKFDIKFLVCQENVRPKIRSDTMLLAHFVDANQELGLKKLSKRWLQTPNRESFAQVAGKGNKNACKIPVQRICDYVYDDVEEVETLFNMWAPQWESHFLHGLEVAVLEDLIDAEIRGVVIDFEKLDVLEKELVMDLEKRRQAVLAILGQDVNLDSPAQVSRAFVAEGVQLLQTTDTGGVTVSKDALANVSGPGVAEYLKYKEVSKIVSTYVKGIRKVTEGGIVHTNFKPFHAVTGRMCIAKGTLVEVVRDVSKYPKGIPIEDVRVGDLVYTFDESRDLTLRKVVWQGCTGNKHVVRVHWQGDGRKHTGWVGCTPEHLIRLIDGTYKRASELCEGDRILSVPRRRIVKVENISNAVDVYDIEVDETNNFIAGELCVHNSCSSPNLQNQPKKGPIRSCFVAREGYYFAECDLAQVELRVLASEAGASVWLETFRQGLDLHRVIAGLMYRKPWETVTDEERYRAKTYNFGVIYGMGSYGLAKRLGIAVEEAAGLLETFFNSDPAIRVYIQRKIQEARTSGFVMTKFGRIRWIPQEGICSADPKTRAFWEHTAVNSPIQGGAADINKICFHRVKLYGQRYGFYPLLTVHDSVLTEVPKSLSPEDHEKIMREAMIFPIDGYVAMDVDYVYGDNWADLKSKEDHEADSDFSEVRECNACIIRREATAPVPPQQVIGAKVMVVGRNPGEQEDKQGYPFVYEAPSGRLLNEVLSALGLRREDLHVTNAVKCHTTMNRVPSPFECSVCADKWLRKEIAWLSPKVILTFGNEAAIAVTGNPYFKVTRDAGKPIECEGCVVFPFPHPSYMLRTGAAKAKVFEEVVPRVRSGLISLGVV